jgi:hypothetical protein
MLFSPLSRSTIISSICSEISALSNTFHGKIQTNRLNGADEYRLGIRSFKVPITFRFEGAGANTQSKLAASSP